MATLGQISLFGRKFSPRYALAGILIAGATVAVIPALATPGSGLVVTPVVAGTFGAMNVKADKDGKWDLFLKTKDDSIVSSDRLDFDPGGQTGWHTHAGPIFATVTSGEITWYDGAVCSWTTYHAGDTIYEPANHLHLVRNNGSAPAQMIGIQIRPEGVAGRLDANAPSQCNF